MADFPASPLFEGLGAWLVQRGLHEAGAEEIVQGFGQRLVAGGVSVSRVTLGGMHLHPVFGARDVTWTARDDIVKSETLPRRMVASEAFRDSPFFWAAKNQVEFCRFPLGAGPVEPDFPVFARFRREGMSDYLLMFESYGRRGNVLWAGLPPGMEGVILGISTQRIGGFTGLEIAYIRSLVRPLALAVKLSMTSLLAKELLNTYLGRYSGARVLDGVIERGDGSEIDCVLFYCDLRGSSRLAQTVPMDTYLALINDYFDCTAGAVTDHGGEVLKFIGDAVMAIFPVDEETRPAVDMCRAALTAAQEAFRRAARVNAAHGEARPPIEFGLALHTGHVMYGNVGTERRLDFTTIGPAVNEVTRLESLCKRLGARLVVSDAFRRHHAGPLRPLGRHDVPGMDETVEVFTAPDILEG